MTIVSTMATKKKSSKKPEGNTKDDRIYIRVKTQIKDDFEAIAHYRGLKSSTLLHSMIVNLIHEEKEKRPQIFAAPQVAEENAKSVESKKASPETEKIAVSPLKKPKSLREANYFKGEKLIDEAPSAHEDSDDEEQ